MSKNALEEMMGHFCGTICALGDGDEATGQAFGLNTERPGNRGLTNRS
jgi:hypothetical protein